MPIRPLYLPFLLLPSLFVAAPALADCGAEGQRACLVTDRIPSCDVNLTEASGTCWRPDCGREGQRGCGPTERVVFDFILRLPVPQVCDANLKHDLIRNLCVHPDCGRDGERACTIFERVPSCDVDLVERAALCTRPACGRLGERICEERVAATFSAGLCDANLVPNLATRLCERPGQPAGQPPPSATSPPAPAIRAQFPAPPTHANPPPPLPSAIPPPPPARSGNSTTPLPAVASGGTSTPPGAGLPLPPGAVAGTAPPPPLPLPAPPPALPAASASAQPPSATVAAAPAAAVAAPVTGPVVSSSGNGVTLSAPAKVLLGQSIDVDWMGPSRTQDYIVLAYPGTPPGLSESIAYRGTRNSPVNLRTPRAPGPLEIWYLDDARKRILHRVTVTIAAPGADASAAAGSAAPSATNGVTLAAPTTVRLGQWITVEWTGPGRSQDYIVLAAPGTAPGRSESIAYGGTRNSPVSLRPPRAPGPYEIWYLDDERKQILHRVTVTITP
jgi:hypothetical protein